MVVEKVVYLIQNPADLHKLIAQFFQSSNIVPIFRIIDKYERLHPFVSQAIYNISCHVVSDILLDICLSETTRTAAHVI